MWSVTKSAACFAMAEHTKKHEHECNYMASSRCSCFWPAMPRHAMLMVDQGGPVASGIGQMQKPSTSLLPCMCSSKVWLSTVRLLANAWHQGQHQPGQRRRSMMAHTCRQIFEVVDSFISATAVQSV